MSWSFSRLRIMREARDAVIAHRLNGAAPAPCPYREKTQSRFVWNHATERANDAVDRLMRIGG